MTPSDKEKFLQLMSVVLHFLSILCSFVTIAGIAYLFVHNREQADRVSFRITYVIAWVDILYSVFSILAFTMAGTSTFCVFLAWGVLWADLSFIFLNVTVAFNLQVVFLQGCKNIRHFERYFVSGSFLAATLIATGPTISKKLGYDPIRPYNCWFVDLGSRSTLLWEWLAQHMWIVLTTVYLLVISVCTVIKLARQSRRILSSGDIYDSQARDAKRLINIAVRRIVLYPMIPILTHGLKMVFMTTQYTGTVFPYYLRIIGLALLSSQGIFNSAVFLFDPALQSTWRRRRLQRSMSTISNDHTSIVMECSDKKPTLQITHMPHSHTNPTNVHSNDFIKQL